MGVHASGSSRWRPMGRRSVKIAVAMVVGALALTSCASGGAETASDERLVGMVGAGLASDPVDGGTLTFSPYAMVSSLDPVRTQASGNTGGTEMAAVYDLLVRFDPDANTFEPQLAQSLESNDAADQWTLTLRPDVTFSDGSTLDAEAVLWSINRFNSSRGVGSALWNDSVESMEATADDTVVFTLKQPWRSFPTMLGSAHGLIVAESSDAGGDFTPIGAGAFVFDRLVPNEELVLTAREDYWGGSPHLSSLRFVPITGDTAKLESLKSGQLDMSLLRDVEPVAQALDDGYSGYVDTTSLGALVMINNRDGRPGADVQVRQAIAQAIDADAFDQRTNQGLGMPDRRVFADWSRWSGDTDALPYDIDAAAQSLAEAKASGYDGSIKVLAMSEPTSQAQALALQAMLQASGFTVEIEYVNSATDLIKRRYVDYDYDIAYSAFNVNEASPYIRLSGIIQSDSSNNALGYQSPEMDQLLEQLKSAGTEEDEIQVIEKIQQLVNDTVPFVALGSHRQFVVWTDKVGGVVPTIDAIMLLDQAWVG